MLRPTGQVTIEKIVCSSLSPWGRACHALQGHPGKHWGWSAARGPKGATRFPQEEVGETGEADAGWAHLRTFSRLWRVGAVPCCLVPGPGMIRAGGRGPEYEPARGQGCLVGPRLVGLHRRAGTPDEPLTMNWLNLGVAGSPGSARPQRSEH